MSSIAGLLRLASLLICLIVIASFAIFAIDQTKSASVHQQQELKVGTKEALTSPPKSAPAHESSVHEAIDEASNQLTSPFSGVTTGSSSEWAIHGVNLLLALAVYGFGLGFLARVIRVRFP